MTSEEQAAFTAYLNGIAASVVLWLPPDRIRRLDRFVVGRRTAETDVTHRPCQIGAPSRSFP